MKDKKMWIVDKAEALFGEKGFEATTVRDIADAAGVNLAMISYYFGSKELLLEELFHRRMDCMHMRIEKLVADTTLTPFEKIEAWLDEYIRKVLDNQVFFRIMLTETLLQKNPVILAHMQQLRLSYAAMFSGLIKEGQRQKLFNKNIDVAMALSTMKGAVMQVVINKTFYAEFSKEQTTDEAELDKLLFKKLSAHLRMLFKTILGYEG